ncbi:MAG: FecR domain-containing protein [Deltaproteobacteria bacterium]|nr:FecR domain-containing protein [Deltaproteobacteria bacterium]
MKKSILYIAALLALLITPGLTLADGAIVETRVEGVGWVTALDGRANIISNGESFALEVGREVFLGDEVSTSIDATAMIELNDGSVVALAPLSRIKITSFAYNEETKENKSYLKLFAGSVRGLLRNLFGSSSKMSFETETSVAGVKGSDISVWLDGDETVVAVNEGSGFIKSKDRNFPGSVGIRAGFMGRSVKGASLKRSVAIPDKLKAKIDKLKVKRNKSSVDRFKKKKEKELKKKQGDKGKKTKKKFKKRIKSGKKPDFSNRPAR